jgi:superoxide dismutase, Fe-Mn family
MSSSGWVWLVTDKFGHLAVVPTFGAGTMLVAGRRQMWYGGQGILVASEAIPSLIRESEETTTRTASPTAPLGSAFSPTSPVSGSSSTGSAFQPPAQSRSLHTSHRLGYDNLGSLTSSPSSLGDAGRQPVPRLGHDLTQKRLGDMVYPLFCVSVHEHAWVSHRGVWGKEQYLKDFWKVLDWHKVSMLFEKWVANRSTM